MPRIYRFGTFEVDSFTRELRKSGLRVRLDAKAFELLLALLENPGELVTREQLHLRLWPSTHVAFERNLNNAMNRLRTALGDSSHAPRFIETLSRRGYRFIAPLGTASPREESTHQPLQSFWRPVAALCAVALVVFVGAFWRLRPVQKVTALPASCVNTDDLLNRMDVTSQHLSHHALRACVANAPSYAPGHTALAISYNRMGASGLLDPETAYAGAIEEAERALALDAGQALAYMARGVARLRSDWNWQEAERDHL